MKTKAESDYRQRLMRNHVFDRRWRPPKCISNGNPKSIDWYRLSLLLETLQRRPSPHVPGFYSSNVTRTDECYFFYWGKEAINPLRSIQPSVGTRRTFRIGLRTRPEFHLKVDGMIASR